MAILNAQQIKEVNEVIAEIEKAIKPKCEIGAHDKPALTALLKAQNLKKDVAYFKCKREYSETIVMHFVKEKSVIKNRFHKNSQAHIFILK
jgi:ATP/maltotriose-dependent transcriptional regulator MalT